MDLKAKIREVPDWPKPGVNFKDITPLLEDPVAFTYVIDKLAEPLLDKEIDKIVGIDARGFLIASPLAYKLKKGLVMVRKKGKLPAATIEKEYSLEYASNIIGMHKDCIKPGEKVVLIDDLCATGGTALATCELIEELGGEIIWIGFLIDLVFLRGSKKLKDKGYDVYSLLKYS